MKQNFSRILPVFFIFFCGILLVPYLVLNSHASPDEERRELWTGRLYSSTYRAGICIKSDGEVYGAVYLRQVGGAVDRYTISGQVEGERITARDYSGHEFKGRVDSKATVRGKLTLSNGHKLNVRALRGPEPEVDEFCRLVQQE
jgi:hypothetical protein